MCLGCLDNDEMRMNRGVRWKRIALPEECKRTHELVKGYGSFCAQVLSSSEILRNFSVVMWVNIRGLCVPYS